MKEYRNPPKVHAPIAAYTHQIEISGNERLLVLSGQIGKKADGSVPDDPIAQFEIALDNLLYNLQAAAMDVHDLVKLTFYLVGDIPTDKRRQVIAAKLHGHQPCMTLLYVAALATPVYKVEIDALASKAA